MTTAWSHRIPDSSLKQALEIVRAGESAPIVLVSGEPILAEPAAAQVAAALAELVDCSVETVRRPVDLAPILADLKTLSLFSSGKVILAVETTVLAERAAAADLIDEAAEVLPVAGGNELAPRERQGARRLLRALELFQLEAGSGGSSGGGAKLLGRLPSWAFAGGTRRRSSRKRGKRQVRELREQLAVLLDLARREELCSWSESVQGELTAVLANGLPKDHYLILCESSVAEEHPLVRTLKERQSLVPVGEVTAQRRGGWQGLDLLARQLAEETGVSIDSRALNELAQRTLRSSPGQRPQRPERQSSVDTDSSARFAAEYRKLAAMVPAGRIEFALVGEVVEDRGEEDVWQVLDDLGSGEVHGALQRLERLLAGAEDPTATRLSVFGLLAGYGRQITAVGGLLDLYGLPRGERNYNRFKSGVAPRLQGELPSGAKSPLAGIHPFRLHRAYLAASNFDPRDLERLPAEVLEAELRIKGESGNPGVALESLVTRLATPSAR